MKIISAAWAAAAVDVSGFPRDGLPQIALAGRSNAGKSTLINALAGQHALARAGRTPGKTRLVHFYLINRAFYLVDLPGFGYARVGRDTRHEMEGALQGYFEAAPQVRGIIYLVDMRVPDSAVDRAALQWIAGRGLPLLVLAVKADKLSRSQWPRALSAIAAQQGLPEIPLPISALRRTGVEAVWEQIGLLLAPA